MNFELTHVFLNSKKLILDSSQKILIQIMNEMFLYSTPLVAYFADDKNIISIRENPVTA